ncbi:hypothetical protein BH24BAC1_BH24BAC1_40590 [soil metagenome]
MTSAPPGPVSSDGQPNRILTAVPPVLARRYELGPPLGQGGSAQVHRAWDPLLKRAVAVKLFPPGLTGPDRDRQDHELAALTRLTHPGLVKLYDAGTDHGWTYLVMPLVQGQSLADRLRDVALPVATVAKMGAQLADALAYVHAHGVTHRDIKPTHVLLDEQDHPLLTDFGIALLVDVTRVTLTGGVIGTAAYMAPEQVRGELVGPSADVYSLGLVLLEALTGRREYPGSSMESAGGRVCRGTGLSEKPPAGTPQTLRRMTAIEATERPSSAEAASVLQAAVTELHGGPAAVDTDLLTELLCEPTEPAVPPDRRRRVVLAGAASVVVLAAGLLGLTALDLSTSGATGIANPPPAAAAPLPARPAGPPLSAAPPAAPAVPQQSAGTPAAAAAPAAAPPAEATGKPAPQARPAASTQAVPPTGADSGSDRSPSDTPGSPGGSPGGVFGDPGGVFGDPGGVLGDPGGAGDPGGGFGDPGGVFGDPGGGFGDPGGVFGGAGSPGSGGGSGGDVDGGFSDGNHG